MTEGLSMNPLTAFAITMGFPGGSDVELSSCNAGDWVQFLD